jgi:hypothetical protein
MRYQTHVHVWLADYTARHGSSYNANAIDFAVKEEDEKRSS